MELLREADDRLATAGDRAALHSRVVAALVRALRHGAGPGPPHTLVAIADRAVALARTSGDAAALATALLARHDALWRPGSATIRLPVVDEMLCAAGDAGDRELVALAHQLRATALLELGDPAGRDELLRFVDLAGQLGHRRGRWAAMTRRATFALIAGRVDEAVAFADEALDLGRSIGEPDALGCWGTLRGSLVWLGGPAPAIGLGRDDPMWPILPLLRAWPPAVSGDLTVAREALGDFSVLDITSWLGLEALTVASAVFAAVGSDDQRRWAYAELLPFAGTHVVVGGCASYQGAVDHHLGVLALALGESASGAAHLDRGLAMHRRLGAAGWERLSRLALDRLESVNSLPDNVFRLVDGQWELQFAGRAAHVRDAKGLHDLALLIAARGADVHVRDLIGPDAGSRPAATGSDPVLDDRAKAQYRRRLDDLAVRLEQAEQLGDADQAARLADERTALIRELARATGLGGRDRRLGDETERARKTVSARLRHSLLRIDRAHPELAAHLRASVRMGTTCRYAPATATRWRLG